MDGSASLLGALVVGVLTGLAPVAAAEVTALAMGALSVPTMVMMLAVFTLGHVGGKMLWFWVGTCESRISHPWLRRWLDRARTVAAAHPRVGVGVAMTSAVASVPPFQLMAIAAGMVGTRGPVFFTIAYAGRFIRFALIAGVPTLFGVP